MTSQCIGEYRVLRKLGAGGMASVYLAAHRDVPNLRTVLKELSNPQLADRFRSEADKLALLDGHAGICQIKHFFEHGGCFYIVMEYIDGPTLDELIRSDNPPDMATSLQFVRSILATLEFAHARGIFHRDIKPTNIMIDRLGQLKIIDFGIAKGATDPDLTQVGSSLGSPRFMAPEQFGADGRVEWQRCDIYAVGVTLYHLLTHAFPFEGADIFEICDAKRTRDPLPPSRLNRAITPHLDAVILKAMARDPAQRFESAAAMRAALSTEEAVAATTDGPRQDVTQVLRSHDANAARPAAVTTTEENTRLDAQPPEPDRPRTTAPPWYRRRPAVLGGVLIVIALAVWGALTFLPPDGRSTPPTLLAPATEVVLANPSVCFKWRSESRTSELFALELSTDRMFSAPRALGPTTADSLRPAEPLADGVYYWRVRAESRDADEPSPWSPVGTFQVKAPAKASAFLTIIIEPRGGVLQVNGDTLGEIKSKRIPLEAGVTYTVVASDPRSPDKPQERSFNLQAGAEDTTRFKFSTPPAPPVMVEVSIGARKDGDSVKATIKLVRTNTELGETPGRVSLPVGRHEIAVYGTFGGVAWAGRGTIDVTKSPQPLKFWIEMQPVH